MTALVQAMWGTTLELAPWLLLGAFVAGVLHVLLPRNFVQRHLTGRGGVLKAVVVGVPLPLCSCGVIPAGLGLKKDGASDGATLGFLISTPQTGVDSILVSASFLGWPFALFKVAAAAVTGWVGGGLVEAFGGRSSTTAGVDAETSVSRPPLRELLPHALELLESIWGWILFGVVASAVIDVWIPAEVLVAWGELGVLGASLLVLLVSLPLYVCATASVPIAASLVAGGMPVGAALVFLMAGPATNVATIGAIYRTLGRRAIGVYLGVIVVGSVGFGWLFEQTFSGWATELAAHEHGASPWEVASAVALLGLTVWFAGRRLSQVLRRRRVPDQPSESSRRLPVSGMTCGGCVDRLERGIATLDGVVAVRVQLDPGEIEVHGAVDDARLRDAIRELGFEPG